MRVTTEEMDGEKIIEIALECRELDELSDYVMLEDSFFWDGEEVSLSILINPQAPYTRSPKEQKALEEEARIAPRNYNIRY